MSSRSTTAPGTGHEFDAADAWVIEPRGPGLRAQLREIWRYRYLFSFFARRAIEKRTMRTILGYWWLLIRPLVPIVLMTFVFGGVMKVTAEGLPYFLFMLSGLSLWMVFRASLMWCTRSLEVNRGIMKQLYFPRIIVPIGTTSPAVVDFLIYLVILAIAFAYYYIAKGQLYLNLGPQLLMVPVAFLFTMMFAIGIGLITSILGAQTRDLRFSLTYFMNFWMLLTPVVYPVAYLDAKWKWLLYLNPMAATIESYKWGLLGYGEMDTPRVLVGFGLILVTLVFGLWYFNRFEAESADRM